MRIKHLQRLVSNSGGLFVWRTAINFVGQGPSATPATSRSGSSHLQQLRHARVPRGNVSHFEVGMGLRAHTSGRTCLKIRH